MVGRNGKASEASMTHKQQFLQMVKDEYERIEGLKADAKERGEITGNLWDYYMDGKITRQEHDELLASMLDAER